MPGFCMPPRSDGAESDTLYKYAKMRRRTLAVFQNALAVVMQARDKVIERLYAPTGGETRCALKQDASPPPMFLKQNTFDPRTSPVLHIDSILPL